jgi:hypothetical protein
MRFGETMAMGYGLEVVDFFRGESGIVGGGDRLQIYRGLGLVIAGDGYIRRNEILTVDPCGSGEGLVVRCPRRNDYRAARRDRTRGSWIGMSIR